jgi:hypothetical protein
MHGSWLHAGEVDAFLFLPVKREAPGRRLLGYRTVKFRQTGVVVVYLLDTVKVVAYLLYYSAKK